VCGMLKRLRLLIAELILEEEISVFEKAWVRVFCETNKATESVRGVLAMKYDE